MANSAVNETVKIRRLRRLMWLFLFATALPTLVLVYKSYDQLKWEAYYQHRQQAEALAERIDSELNSLVFQEESRAFGDYGFLVVGGSEDVNYLRRSPLSEFPAASDLPGLVGYFQIDPDGQFSSPLTPNPITLSNRYGISAGELEARVEAQSNVQEILSSNELLLAGTNGSKADLLRQAEPNRARSSRLESILDNSLSRQAQSPSPAQLEESLSYERFESADEAADDVDFAAQSAFDEISKQNAAPPSERKNDKFNDGRLSKLEEFELDAPYSEQRIQREDEKVRLSKSAIRKQELIKQKQAAASEKKAGQRKITIEKGLIEEQAAVVLEDKESGDLAQPGFKIFENEIDPFELSLLESGHLVFFRKVWRDGKRYIQGILVEQEPFMQAAFQQLFGDSLIAGMSNLAVVYQGDVLSIYGNSGRDYRALTASSLTGTLLYQNRMSAPFDDLETVFTIQHLPAGPGGTVILWSAFILTLVLAVGTYLLYRLSLKNLKLVGQQQDFVSAVSHELKTPLTSIRMYGEILKSGWADEEKKKGYYHFIFDESERLTRLINNVLELARMTRNETRASPQPMTVNELVDTIHSKIDSQVERAGFKLKLDVQEGVEGEVLNIDPDLFAQIVINLVDNALKFSAKAEQKEIEIAVRRQSGGKAVFSVRDYGPGIARDQMKKIFELFYRTENELTRETTGTGIGLALVSQLTQLMKGKVDVVNCEPGAEFGLYFPVAAKS